MAGNDTLIGGAGNDYLDGGAGVDIASYANETAAIAITLNSAVVTVALASGTDTLIAIEGVTGGSGDDVLTGGAGNNTLDGGAGNDTIEGGAGTDILIGGANGTTGDTVTYANATAGVKVSLALTSAQNTVGAGSDKLSGFENLRGSVFDDTLTGSAGDNTINGGEGNDKLYGGDGNDNLRAGQHNDLLNGGAGNDLLNGGQGADTFLFATKLGAANIDTVQDFKASELDKISLENAIFTKIGAVGSLTAAAFVSGAGAVATSAEDRIIYDTANGKLYYDADGSGAGAQVQFAIVYTTGTTPAALASSDFLIV
jgi:serralysin